MSRSLKIFIPVFVIILAIAAYLIVPNIWAKAVPDFLNKNISQYLIVDNADFSRSPPELILTGVHLKNPAQFGEGDAITIGQVNVVFNDYSHSPYHIQSITVQDIAGKQIIRNETDNFTFIHNSLMDKKIQTPRGKLADKVVLKSFIIHNARVSNEDGSINTPLAEKRLTPQGAMADNPALQNVIIDVLGTGIEQQKDGTAVLAVEGLANKAGETIKSIGDSIKNFLSAP